MPDKVTEFVNVTGLTLTNFQGAGYTILTNSATETAVIRDVTVTSTGSGTLTFTDSPNTLFTTSGSAKLTGTELIGSSSTVKAINNDTYAFNQIILFTGSSSGTIYTTNLTPATIPYSPTAGQASTVSTTSFSFSARPDFAGFAANGDFYYKQSGSSTLYRRIGGINGTQSNIGFVTGAARFDGRYIYAIESYYGYAYDTQTNTTIYFGTSRPSYYGSSYAQCYGLDGFVLHKTDAYQPQLTSIFTGSSRTVSNLLTNPGQNTCLGICKVGNNYYLIGSAQYNDANFINIGSNPETFISTGTAAGSLTSFNYGTSNLGTVFGNNSSQNSLNYAPNIASGFITRPNSGSTLFFTDFATGTPVTTEITPSNSSGLNSSYGGFIASLNQAAVVSSFGNVSLRITGIKTT